MFAPLTVETAFNFYCASSFGGLKHANILTHQPSSVLDLTETSSHFPPSLYGQGLLLYAKKKFRFVIQLHFHIVAYLWRG